MISRIVKLFTKAKKTVEVLNTPTLKPVYVGAKVGRNEVCPCGSGAKFKKCCLR